MNQEHEYDTENDMFDDVETLREKLVELSERDLIVQTKKFLMDKRRCTEKVMRKIMAEYEDKRRKSAKAEMAIALVGIVPSLIEKSGIVPSLIEKSGIVRLEDGAQSFSAKILADKNTMFCITDLIPVYEGGDYYILNISAH